jgi:hypothetical protein
MKIVRGALGACLLLAAVAANAQDAVGNGVPQPRIGPAKKLSAQECTDRMAASASGPKDAATKQQDRYCSRLLKKQAAMKPASAP